MCFIFKICKKDPYLYGYIGITGSKSESNRLLLLQAIYTDKIKIKIDNLSHASDTNLLRRALKNSKSLINIEHAGTSMRFLTSYFSIKDCSEIILTGSNRMKQRPISVLVNALRILGSRIFFLEKEGFPPLKICGKKISGWSVPIDPKISSQYISALILIGSSLLNGLKLFFSLEKITSSPYVQMTLNILKKTGIKISWMKNFICINPTKNLNRKVFSVESDWSSASYYYALSAISKTVKIRMSYFEEKSYQGDSFVAYIYRKYFGINTIFTYGKMILSSQRNNFLHTFLELDLNSMPDIAQTIAVTCAALRRKCFLIGLETLKIKETNRLKALQKELFKIGVLSIITENSFQIIGFEYKKENLFFIKTYEDHRMAMSFAPFSLRETLNIGKPEVVEKSYTHFWNDLRYFGFGII
ncbi:MAG TPA: 3-phosphoshikimate 1-carboxyvinyltransferase [Candidatus Angelobacter sp.]|jgi:3-phosphoshikimate 1-carboxyvinyltransferase|nr:3-phosphoshikimate 1-carboxyvinyltransferase [Candidatus Angelobacter sp.]